jgi:hypothetical protein
VVLHIGFYILIRFAGLALSQMTLYWHWLAGFKYWRLWVVIRGTAPVILEGNPGFATAPRAIWPVANGRRPVASYNTPFATSAIIW